MLLGDPIFTAWNPSSFDDKMGERNHFTGQQITRSDGSSHKIWRCCRENSFAFKSHFIHTAVPLSMLLKNINDKGRFLFTPMQNSRLNWPTNECFELKGKIWPLGKPTAKAYNHCLFYCFDLVHNCTGYSGSSTQPMFWLALTYSSFDEAMGDFNKEIMHVSHRKFRTALNFEVTTTLN